MKVVDLANELKLSTGVVIGLINELGYTEITHHMHSVNNEIVEKVRSNASKADEQLRPAFTINRTTDNKFSILVLGYTSGDFSKKLDKAASDLGVSSTDLYNSLKKHGYPIVQNEYTEDIRYKSQAIMQFRKYVGNSVLWDDED